MVLGEQRPGAYQQPCATAIDLKAATARHDEQVEDLIRWQTQQNGTLGNMDRRLGVLEDKFKDMRWLLIGLTLISGSQHPLFVAATEMVKTLGR